MERAASPGPPEDAAAGAPRVLVALAGAAARRALQTGLAVAGFAVEAVETGEAALARCRAAPPALVLCGPRLPDMDGTALRGRVAQDPRLRSTPFVVLTREPEPGELAAGDPPAATPALLELVARIHILLGEEPAEEPEEPTWDAPERAALPEGGLAQLLPRFEAGARSGTVHLVDGRRRHATVWLRDGSIADCEAEGRIGEPALERALRWSDGEYLLAFEDVDRPARVTRPTAELVEEGLRRARAWREAVAALPPLDAVHALAPGAEPERLGDAAPLARLLDGRRTLAQVLERADGDDLAAVDALARLVREGLARPVPPERRGRPPRVVRFPPSARHGGAPLRIDAALHAIDPTPHRPLALAPAPLRAPGRWRWVTAAVAVALGLVLLAWRCRGR